MISLIAVSAIIGGVEIIRTVKTRKAQAAAAQWLHEVLDQ